MTLISRVCATLATTALALALTACYTPAWQTLSPNLSQADVQAQLGKPKEVYPLAPASPDGSTRPSRSGKKPLPWTSTHRAAC